MLWNISLGCTQTPRKPAITTRKTSHFFGSGIPRLENLYLSLCILCVGWVGGKFPETNSKHTCNWAIPPQQEIHHENYVDFQGRTVSFRESISRWSNKPNGETTYPNLARRTWHPKSPFEPRKKNLITFHYTGWLIGILIMVYIIIST